MKVYLAARYSTHPQMRVYRKQLKALGHKVTSRWVNGDHEYRTPGDQSEVWAEEDFADLIAADCSIHFTEDWTKPTTGRNRGGRHVEFGIALAMARGFDIHEDFLMHMRHHRIIVIGHRENVFHNLRHVEFYPDWDSALEALTAEARAGVRQ